MLTKEEIKLGAIERAQIYLDQAIKRRAEYVAELEKYTRVYEIRKESYDFGSDGSAPKIAEILEEIKEEIFGVNQLIKSYKKFLFLERVKYERA